MHVCGLNAKFHCTVTDCRTCTQQRIDSDNGHGLLDQLSTRFPVCCDTGLEISPESFSSTEQYLPTSLVGLSISVHKDTETWNIGCTPDAGCWLHVKNSASNFLPCWSLCNTLVKGLLSLNFLLGRFAEPWPRAALRSTTARSHVKILFIDVCKTGQQCSQKQRKEEDDIPWEPMQEQPSEFTVMRSQSLAIISPPFTPCR